VILYSYELGEYLAYKKTIIVKNKRIHAMKKFIIAALERRMRLYRMRGIMILNALDDH